MGNGVVGRAVAAELKHRGETAVLAARHPGEDSGHIQLDALDGPALLAASRGASHLYITLGMEYSAKVWERNWPRIMDNALAAAQANGCKIIFFDNIYMYGPPPLHNPITEEHIQAPVSRKGKVRQQIADQLMQAHADGRVHALIGRSADYYGPKATNSPLYITGLKRLLDGKGPQLLSSPSIKHSYTYTPDAARALAELALDDGAYGQVWHLPTAAPALTDQEILAKLAVLTNNPKRATRLDAPMIAGLSLFIPLLREVREMLYQYDADYVFSSAKFEGRYPNFAITSYDDGLKAMVESFK